MPYVDEQLLKTRLSELDDILAHYDKRLAFMPKDFDDVRKLSVIHGKRIHQEEKDHLLKVQASENSPDLEDSFTYVRTKLERIKEETPFEYESGSKYAIEQEEYYQKVIDLMERALEYDIPALLELLQRTGEYIDKANKRVALGKPALFHSSHIVICHERLAHFSRLLVHARSIQNKITLPQTVCVADDVPLQSSSVVPSDKTGQK